MFGSGGVFGQEGIAQFVDMIGCLLVVTKMDFFFPDDVFKN